MRQRILTFTVAAAAVLVAIFVSIQPRHQSEAAVASQPEVTSTTRVDTSKIVPADVLGTGVVNWAPLTGDGSN